MGSSQTPTVEQHNATRRAAKARQRANRRAAAKGKTRTTETGSVLSLARQERDRREQRERLSAKNGARLLEKVNENGSLTLRIPGPGATERDLVRFNHDVHDVKDAAKASPNRYHWRRLGGGSFFITKAK